MTAQQQSWFAVFRKDIPVAYFFSRALAEEWTKSAPHRTQDTIIKCQLRLETPPAVPSLPHPLRSEDRWEKNLCRRCGQPAQHYGEIGGYSVQCEKCNAAQGVKRRAASARRRAEQ